MKHKLFITFIVCFIMFFMLAPAHADWSVASDWIVRITGERDEYAPYVMLGLAKEEYSLSNPPEPMGFKCNIMLRAMDDQRPLKRDIRMDDQSAYEWILSVNPHGESPPYETTCVISWNPLDIGPGNLKLLDHSGNVLIDSMKRKTSYSVSSSSNKYLHYRLHYQKTSLLDIIAYLQILAGFNPVSGSDTDVNGKIEMNDILSMLRDVTK